MKGFSVWFHLLSQRNKKKHQRPHARASGTTEVSQHSWAGPKTRSAGPTTSSPAPAGGVLTAAVSHLEWAGSPQKPWGHWDS